MLQHKNITDYKISIKKSNKCLISPTILFDAFWETSSIKLIQNNFLVPPLGDALESGQETRLVGPVGKRDVAAPGEVGKQPAQCRHQHEVLLTWAVSGPQVLLAASTVSRPLGGTGSNQATWESVSQGHEKNLEKTISFTLN